MSRDVNKCQRNKGTKSVTNLKQIFDLLTHDITALHPFRMLGESDDPSLTLLQSVQKQGLFFSFVEGFVR